jgi:hypothetical protein
MHNPELYEGRVRAVFETASVDLSQDPLKRVLTNGCVRRQDLRVILEWLVSAKRWVDALHEKREVLRRNRVYVQEVGIPQQNQMGALRLLVRMHLEELDRGTPPSAFSSSRVELRFELRDMRGRVV